MNTTSPLKAQFPGQWAGQNDQPQTVNPPQVSEWLNNCISELEQFEKTLLTLQEKISPVVRPSIPCPESCGKPEEALVPVADKARKIYQRIQHYRSIVQDLTDRTEL